MVGGGNDYLFFNKLLYFAEATVREIAQPAHNAEKFESILKQDTPLPHKWLDAILKQVDGE